MRLSVAFRRFPSLSVQGYWLKSQFIAKMELAQDFFGKKIIEHFGAETAVLDITLKTDLGMRPAHPHQLRDTCAVWYIRQSALIQDVAKMLGDTVAMVERHYLPYIEELKDAHVATNKRILEAARAD